MFAYGKLENKNKLYTFHVDCNKDNKVALTKGEKIILH